MSFRFVHTADWQIGRPFRTFDAGTASQLALARLDAIDKIAEVARSAGAQHVVVAGDLYDSPNLANAAVRQPLQRMRHAERLHWWILPGNHDPVRAGGVWERVMTLGCPPNVTVLTQAVPVEMERGVWLLPAPLTAKSTAEDPTGWMDGASTPLGAMRIGLAHGSVRSFGSRSSADSGEGVIDPRRAALAGLDYLALGDWHGAIEIGPKTWYSGTPEPDRFLDNDAGFALAVSVPQAGAPVVIARHRTASYAWVGEEARVAGAADLAAIEARVLAASDVSQKLIVRLKLTGQSSATFHAELSEWREIFAAHPRMSWLGVDTAGVALTAGLDDIDALGDETLRAVAHTLAERGADGGDRQRRTAQAALAKLFELTRRVGSVPR
jgi:DNA repair exonuclease SbcCD nuclease subunit